MSPRIRTYADLREEDASGLAAQVEEQVERVARRLEPVRRLVAVMSGKGGVGKSFVAAALATSAARRGLRTGLIDADLNGPTADRLLGVDPGPLTVGEEAVVPPESADGVALISMALLLEPGAPLRWREPEAESHVWRGTQERNAVREFLSDVAWGPRDLLLVDLPPGPQRLVELAELVPRLSGTVAVTLPSAASGASVERSLALCRERGIPVAGVVENMAGYACPSCGEVGGLFAGAEGERLASAFDVELLARLPFDAGGSRLAEEGRMAEALEGTALGRGVGRALDRLLELEGPEVA